MYVLCKTKLKINSDILKCDRKRSMLSTQLVPGLTPLPASRIVAAKWWCLEKDSDHRQMFHSPRRDAARYVGPSQGYTNLRLHTYIRYRHIRRNR